MFIGYIAQMCEIHYELWKQYNKMTGRHFFRLNFTLYLSILYR